jgi:hypothetical protein
MYKSTLDCKVRKNNNNKKIFFAFSQNPPLAPPYSRWLILPGTGYFMEESSITSTQSFPLEPTPGGSNVFVYGRT